MKAVPMDRSTVLDAVGDVEGQRLALFGADERAEVVGVDPVGVAHRTVAEVVARGGEHQRDSGVNAAHEVGQRQDRKATRASLGEGQAGACDQSACSCGLKKSTAVHCGSGSLSTMVDRKVTKSALPTVIDKKDDAFLGQNIKGLMMSLIAAWNAAMDATRAGTEFADVRPADIRVFAQLRGRSLRLSDVHREMGFSRQAAQQAVDRLVDHGMLRVDLVDGSKRDKTVSITEKGQRWRTIAAAEIRRIEEQIAAVVGDADKEKLRRILVAVLKAET